jgi:hypothetical protein
MVYGFYNLADKIKRYYAFGTSEKRWLIASAFILAFIVGFDDGSPAFKLTTWLGNFMLCLIAVVVAMFVHETVRRIFGLEQGFKTETKPFMYGLIGGLVLAFMSYGKIPLPFLAYGGAQLQMLEAHRLGYFRHRTSMNVLGKISALACIANLFVAVIFFMMKFLPAAFVDKMILVNVSFAIINLLPIPPLDGANLLFASRTIYLSLLVFTVIIGILIMQHWISISLIWVLAIAFVVGTVVAWMVVSDNMWGKSGWARK